MEKPVSAVRKREESDYDYDSDESVTENHAILLVTKAISVCSKVAMRDEACKEEPDPVWALQNYFDTVQGVKGDSQRTNKWLKDGVLFSLVAKWLRQEVAEDMIIKVLAEYLFDLVWKDTPSYARCQRGESLEKMMKRLSTSNSDCGRKKEEEGACGGGVSLEEKLKARIQKEMEATSRKEVQEMGDEDEKEEEKE